MTEPPNAASEGLLYSLLDDPLISYRHAEDGRRLKANLPELFVAMCNDEVRDFPALRPHQRHPWHAFLCQVAAIALHQADQTEPLPTADAWRQALLSLTPNDLDGAAWCLVSPPSRPALLQAPVRGSDISSWDVKIDAPDRLDMLITSRNHDQKRSRMVTANAEDWLFALLSLQTQEGSNSGSYKGISRMNSGAGSRPSVGVSPGLGFGRRWRTDVTLLLKHRAKISDDYNLRSAGGVALVWLAPWNGTNQISFAELDPLYVEICRQVRLVVKSDRLWAATSKTPIARISAEERKGVTGDPWAPINSDKECVLWVPDTGFGYALMTDLMLGGNIKPSIAQDMTNWPTGTTLHLYAQGIARGNSKTFGMHERRVPISPKVRRLMLGSERASLAGMAKDRVAAVGDIHELLEQSILVLFGSGSLPKKLNPSTRAKRDKFARPFELREDARFFVDLTAEVEADDARAARLNWLIGLVARAEETLKQAFDAGPRNGMQRYRAQAAALSRFHSALRGVKSPLPMLAQHYQDSRKSNEEETQT